jgi:hypothetical protein
MNRNRRHHRRRRRRLHPDIHHRRALPEEQPVSDVSDETTNQSVPPSFDSFSDDDFKRAIRNALRLVVIAVAVGAPLLWWKLGWPSAALFAVGALISGSGLYEWLRLMTALIARMDEGATAKPIAGVIAGFFLRLGIAVALLYGSLKLLNGSIYAIAAGLALGVAALTIEGLRLVKSWTAQ